MHGFYVQDGDTFYIIPAGQIYEDPNMVYPALNCVITPSGLKEIASDYVDFLKEQQTAYEEWIKENPDEDPDLYAGGETYSPPALTENAAVVDVDGVSKD